MKKAMTASPVRSAGGRALLWIAASLVAAVILVLAVHVMIRPVTPAQQAPIDHFGGPCGLCHFISEGVDDVSVE
ncbi:MAG: hypothetical protein CVT66_09065 [Actinobacteria bacterium HGW-Actinobacteria-6]|nr:MAG: hypothetical protein CVT66_09065 [Actinobacteria bacterium HGW-Actinobacteria-6]